MPIDDWQFWAVTAIALIAMGAIGRRVVAMLRPLWRKQSGGVRRASLTISAKRDGGSTGGGR